MTSKIDLSPLKAAGLPQLNLSQYLGLWAIEERAAMALADLVRSLDLAAHVASHVHDQADVSKIAFKLVTMNAAGQMRSDAGSSKPAASDAQIAIIEIRGAMTKQGSSLSDAGSMVRMRQAMRSARLNPDIDAVLVLIDSPGGTVTGLAELADEYAALSAMKPTLTFVEDQMCSAAMWVGVQGREVWANADHTTVGSKGVFVGLYDCSEQAAASGIKPVVIRTGDLKGAGFPGEQFTDDQRAMWQTLVNAANSSFDKAMGKRNLSEEAKAELSRGGVFTAKAAVSMGLIDGISSFDDALSRLRSQVPKGKRKGAQSMSDTNTAAAASLSELRSACPGASNDFLVSQIEQGATLSTAQANWMSALRAKNDALEAKAKEADEVAKKLATVEASNKELTEKLSAAEAKSAKLTQDLKEANSSLSAFKKGSGYRGVPDIGKRRRGDTGYPGKPVKAPNKEDDVDPDADEEEDDDTGNATAEWNREVNALEKRGMKRHLAVQQVIRKSPELHQRYVEAANAERNAG